MTPSWHTHQGKSILLLSGDFGDNAASNVQRAVQRTNDYDEVWMCSRGGLVDQGTAIGRQLSDARATVRVPRGFRCVSSCTIAFMGGFVRIIEPGSQYIVHASSAFSEFNLGQPRYLDCAKSGAASVCNKIAGMFDQPEHQCSSFKEIKDPNSSCIILDPNYGSSTKTEIVYRAGALAAIPPNPELLLFFADHTTDREIKSTIDLLHYYQEMLLADHARHIRSNAYDGLRAQFRPVRLYDPANYGQDARSLVDDVLAINGAEIFDRTVIWQSILTDAELNVKRQVIEYIKTSGINFGPAGSDAVKILEAMVICQIQTECRLQPSEAAALGIQNVFDAE